MDVKFDGRVALVTGASLGIGLAMAREFSLNGAEVALVARRQEVLNAAVDEITAVGGGRVKGYSADVSRGDDIERLFSEVESDFGRVDILINNAGHAKTGAIEDITDDEWQYDLDLKLMAAVRLSRLAFPGMKARKWGRIINMLNTAAKTPGARSAPTSVTRAAGMALTKVLASEGAPHNILVNGFNIGRIKSDQIKRAHDRSSADMSLDDFIARAGTSVPLGRMGDAEEVANLACLLCSDACGYVTGTSINVDGGLSPAL